MANTNVIYNLDTILLLASQAAWIIFTIYAVIFFIRSLRRHGPRLTIIRMLSFRVLGPLLLAMAITLASVAVVFIQPQYVGVVVSILSPGGVRPQPLPGGFHLIVPFLEQVREYPIYWQTYTMSTKPTEGEKYGNDTIRARTSDGQEVFLDCSVIFQVNPNQAVQIHIDWQERYIREFVRPVVRGFVRTQVSQFTVEEVNSSSRRDLEATLDRLLQDEFTNKGLTLDQFLLRDVTFSPEYSKSIEDKQVALEGQVQTLYQAEQIRRLASGEADAIEIRAQAEANAIEIKAQAQAQALKLIGQSLAENPDLVTYHYVEKLSPNMRAMLVPNNNPLILPLPPSLLEETSPLTPTQTPTETLQIDLPRAGEVAGEVTNVVR